MQNGFRTLTSSDLRDISATKDTEFGAIGLTADGRVFRYALAGASDATVGKLHVAEAKVANHTNIAVAAAAAIGATAVSVTLGATAATQDQYAEGYLTVNDSTGAGTTYRISGHPAIGSAGTGFIYLEEPLKVALTTSSKVVLQKNPQSAIITSTTASLAAGVPNVTITAAYYGWVQTGGIASVLADGITAKATGAIQSGSVAGALVTEAAGTLVQRVAFAPEATVDTKYYPFFLSVNPL